eukprot:6193088-Pleurochrysis_carterae.AAC.3
MRLASSGRAFRPALSVISVMLSILQRVSQLQTCDLSVRQPVPFPAFFVERVRALRLQGA